MKNLKVTIMLFSFLFLGAGANPYTVAAEELSLVGLLMEKLGVTQTQAEGGAGALFRAAKQSLSTEEFDQVAATVPDMESLIKAAPESNDSLNDMMSKGASLFGGESNQQLSGVMDLASSFSELGLSPDMVKKYVPVVLDYVEAQGGETVRNLLASALL